MVRPNQETLASAPLAGLTVQSMDAVQPPVDPITLAGRLTFTIPKPTPLVNVLSRLHWQKLLQANRALGAAVRVATHGKRPLKPFPLARVEIERRSIGVPDHDGLVGGVKALVDALLPPGKPYVTRKGTGKAKWVLPHPTGQSIIADDNPGCLQLVVTSTRVRTKKEQCTVVTVTALTPADFN